MHLLLETLDPLLSVFECSLERGALIVGQADLVVVFDNEVRGKESFQHRIRGATFGCGEKNQEGGAERDEGGMARFHDEGMEMGSFDSRAAGKEGYKFIVERGGGLWSGALVPMKSWDG